MAPIKVSLTSCQTLLRVNHVGLITNEAANQVMASSAVQAELDRQTREYQSFVRTSDELLIGNLGILRAEARAVRL